MGVRGQRRKLADHDGVPYLEPGFYINLCANTGYREFLKRHLEEVLRLTEFDGVWIDASSWWNAAVPPA